MVAGVDAAGESVPLDFERVLPTPSEFADGGRVRSAQAEELLALYLGADLLERQRLARGQPLVATMASEVALGQPIEEVTLWDASDWRSQNWGTKWTAMADSFRVDDMAVVRGRVVMRFSTAWSPPRPLVLELIRCYAELAFDLVYSEPDGGGAGRVTGMRGEVAIDEETREPAEAVVLLAEADWPEAADDWRDPDNAEL